MKKKYTMLITQILIFSLSLNFHSHVGTWNTFGWFQVRIQKFQTLGKLLMWQYISGTLDIVLPVISTAFSQPHHFFSHCRKIRYACGICQKARRKANMSSTARGSNPSLTAMWNVMGWIRNLNLFVKKTTKETSLIWNLWTQRHF